MSDPKVFAEKKYDTDYMSVRIYFKTNRGYFKVANGLPDETLYKTAEFMLHQDMIKPSVFFRLSKLFLSDAYVRGLKVSDAIFLGKPYVKEVKPIESSGQSKR